MSINLYLIKKYLTLIMNTIAVQVNEFQACPNNDNNVLRKIFAFIFALFCSYIIQNMFVSTFKHNLVLKCQISVKPKKID